MRKLRDVLRLKYETQLPLRAIGQACGLGLGTVSTYLQRATAAGLTWPVPDDLDDSALEARLFTRPTVSSATDRALPEWATLHQELKKPGVTLTLLWQEYRARHPHGYAYQPVVQVTAADELTKAWSSSPRRRASSQSHATDGLKSAPTRVSVRSWLARSQIGLGSRAACRSRAWSGPVGRD